MPVKKTKEQERKEETKDKKLEEKIAIKPIIDEAMHKFLGVTIDEMSEDITEKLKRSPLIDFEINTRLSFKKAKKEFLRKYLQKLLQINYGNISEVARIADVNRRSIHRIIKGGYIDVSRIRKEMAKAYDIKQGAVSTIIEDVLDSYKEVIHPEKINEVYKHIGDVSKDILESLPERQLSLKEAEEEFERSFIKKALAENGNNITKTARKIGLRYETQQRKMKRLGSQYA